MLIADKKKKESITDYLLFMYHTEELIRHTHFDLKKIEQYVSAHYSLEKAEKESSMHWYRTLAEQMKTQRLEERGHLDFLHEDIKSLGSLSMELLKVDKEYRLLYDKAKVFIQKNLEGGNGSLSAPIFTCLHALFEAQKARQKGESPKISAEDLHACQETLAYLSYKYKQRKNVTS